MLLGVRGGPDGMPNVLYVFYFRRLVDRDRSRVEYLAVGSESPP